MTPYQRQQLLRMQGLDPDDASILAGAETGALSNQHSAWRAISIGVATAAITFVVTRVLEDLFPRRRS